ncbi:diguanylate cyclase domain-containing protein [Altericista sp. CCNU0014]|uniref:GGDEF domain-containing response regulator n=1 Tax=Altericista sp. CCNU0014 TaxID=3082949 RepID=UPI00384E2416
MNSESFLSSSRFDLLKSLILIVDDDRLVRMQLRVWLEADGYRVVEASDSASCLAAYEQYHPDLVLLDLVLPDRNGLDCCAQIYGMSGGSYTPIVVLTECEDEQSIERAFALGVADYVTKPIPWLIFRHRLRRFLEESQKNRRLETENQQLTRLATLDGLTRIPNRRRFDEHLDAMWRQMVREEDWIAIAIGDVDFFKAYNDTYGHLAGDRCLQQIAETLRQCCYRPLDLVARYGGEEFSIVLPQTNLAGALSLAERLRVAIDTLKIPHSGSEVDGIVTMSFGVAAARPDVNMWADLLLEATDAALYKAKSLGRHQAYGVKLQGTPQGS